MRKKCKIMILFGWMCFANSSSMAQEPVIDIYTNQIEKSAPLPEKLLENHTKNNSPKKPVKNTWEYGSIMYEDKAVGWIKEAIKSFEEGIPLEILLPTIFPPVKTDKEIVEFEEEEEKESINLGMIEDVEGESKPKTPSFYLKSILYFSPTNWSIWLNDNKLSSTDKYKGLEIIKVTNNYVAFLWRAMDLDKIFPDWRNEFFLLEDSQFASNNKNIVIKVYEGDVSFILKPNQSFITKDLKIIEGSYKTTAVADKAVVNGDTDGAMFEKNTIAELNGELEILPKAKTEIKNSVLRSNSPDDGMESMQKYMMQLNILKSAIENTN